MTGGCIGQPSQVGMTTPISPIVGERYSQFVTIEHIVAPNEADESGLRIRPLTERDGHAVDLLNFTLASSS